MHTNKPYKTLKRVNFLYNCASYFYKQVYATISFICLKARTQELLVLESVVGMVWNVVQIEALLKVKKELQNILKKSLGIGESRFKNSK